MVLVVLKLLQKKVWQCIMAVSKGKKQVKQAENPNDKTIRQGGDPNQYYKENPVWSFSIVDTEMWSFTQEHLGELFWLEVLPRMQSLETQKWQEILVKAQKENHTIDVSQLNKNAQRRLAEKYIEADSIVSLRITGTHRLYGFITGKVFNILWFDDEHGDNDRCVCRSYKKHT